MSTKVVPVAARNTNESQNSSASSLNGQSTAAGTVECAKTSENSKTSKYVQWADSKDKPKAKVGFRVPRDKKYSGSKKKKCFVCNPYTLWFCRDYPTAAIICGIVVVFFIIWDQLYNIPFTEEQQCPVVETSKCDAEGNLCDAKVTFSGEESDGENCEEDSTCSMIYERFDYNGNLEEHSEYCGPTATCMYCINTEEYSYDNTYDIQVTRCVDHNSSTPDLESFASYLFISEFKSRQDFQCSNHSATLLAEGLILQHDHITGNMCLLVLIIIGAVVYYLLLLQGYSKFTGKPRLKWAFSGEFLKPKPRILRQHKKGQAPVLGGNLDIKTNYKDLFKHPWTCFVCKFEMNDPGSKREKYITVEGPTYNQDLLQLF
jgi:hypothetical protein